MIDLLHSNNSTSTCLQDENNIYSFSDINALAATYSEYLFPRSTALILTDNTVGSVLSYLSCLRSGCIPLLLPRDTDPKIISFYLQLYKIQLVLCPDDCSSLFNAYSPSFISSGYSILIGDVNASIKVHPQLALLLTTSGSTGNPKLVKLSYANLKANALAIIQYLNISQNSKHITTLPMSYTYGLSCINTHLLSGGCIVLNNSSVIERAFWDSVYKYEPNTLSGVPYSYELLSRFPDHKLIDSPFTVFTQAGGKLSNKLILHYAQLCNQSNKKFYVMYGQTEATARMSYLPPDKLISKIGSIGIPIPGGRFQIKPIDTGLSIDSTGHFKGELIYYGENIFMGYANCGTDLSSEPLSNDFLETGDIAYCDQDGYYFISGRLNRFTKLFGKRISLNDLESQLRESNISCAIVSDDIHIIAFIEESSSLCFDKSVAIAKTIFLESINLNVRFSRFVKIDKIPRSSSGKIQYSSLPKV